MCFSPAFLGKLSGINETEEGLYLTFHVQESYKGIGQAKKVTVLKKKDPTPCSCVPFILPGKAHVFGKFGQDKDGLKVPMFNELTFVEKFYSFKQMSLCWLF